MYPRWCLIAFFWRLGRWFGQTISCSNFWRVTFVALGGQKYQHDDSVGLKKMRVHSLHQYLIPTYMWYKVAHWWTISRGFCKSWRLYDYLNVSWSSTPDFAGCWFEIPILIPNNNEWQLLHGKRIKQLSLIYLSDLYARERHFVQVWKVEEMNLWENPTIFLRISAVVDLHEGSGLIDEQIIMNSITLT